MGKVKLPDELACPACGGNGSVVTDPCEDCRGYGYVAGKVRLDVIAGKRSKIIEAPQRSNA